MEEQPREMTPQGLSTLQLSTLHALTFWKRSGGHVYFKHHMAWHLARRAGTNGNPRFYHAFADEGEN
eukprot:8367247-Alexandrium_andersonii.AAC.1